MDAAGDQVGQVFQFKPLDPSGAARVNHNQHYSFPVGGGLERVNTPIEPWLIWISLTSLTLDTETDYERKTISIQMLKERTISK